MSLIYRIAADFVVIFHFAYVGFVIGGFFLILLGILRGWSWVRNRTFRYLHLAAILLVAFEALVGIVCPLTEWENALRQRAGQATYQGDFVARWVHDCLFIQAEPWVFTTAYAVFAAAVAATFVWAPPRGKRRSPERMIDNDK